MDLRLQEIVGLNEILFKKVETSLPAIIESLQKGKFQNTGKALVSFVHKSISLNNSILNSCVNRDLYSAWIVSRSMIEHNFRYLYIYTRTLNENSDSVGRKYYGELKSFEDLKSFSKINTFAGNLYPEKTKWSTKGEHNKNIADVGKEFDIEKIFYSLISSGDSGGIQDLSKDYLLKRLTDYTNLSSAVHGGPFSEIAWHDICKNKNKLNNLIYKCAEDSLALHKSLIESTYLFAYTVDDSLGEHYESIVHLEDSPRDEADSEVGPL